MPGGWDESHTSRDPEDMSDDGENQEKTGRRNPNDNSEEEEELASFCSDGIRDHDDNDTTEDHDDKDPSEDTSSTKGDGFRRLTRRMSREIVRQRSSLVEALPDTPAGWTVLLSFLMSTGLGYEISLQKSLTKPPATFGQLSNGGIMAHIHEEMTKSADSILSRDIQPSLFVGTRGMISSTAAYLFGGPSSADEHLRFREIVACPQDGAQFAVDWEVPWKGHDLETANLTAEERKAEIRNGTIRQPVVIILHGLNNDAGFGYIKSFQREFANRGWNAAAMNFRGCGGVPMTTPRGYNGSYTGDLRTLVWSVSSRLADDVPVFLIGNSLGANLLTKYLGEEGLSGTLPKCVAGGVSLGNPLLIDGSLAKFPFNTILALGVKRVLLENWSAFTKMRDPFFRESLRKGMLSTTIGDFDRAVSPIMARNSAFHPYAFRVGFEDGPDYWHDSSSYRLIRHISVPFLNLSAEDDFLVAEPSKNKLGFCLSNPNVMVVETRCGGHLGWHESPPDSDSTFGGSSWANIASGDFIAAVMKTNVDTYGSRRGSNSESVVNGVKGMVEIEPAEKDWIKADANATSRVLQSRL